MTSSRTFTTALSLAAALLAPLPLAAQTPVESLSRCLADNTTGKERKEFARWVFLAMAAHPEIRQFTAPDIAAGVVTTDKAVAAIFTKLLAQTCVAQTQATMKQGGALALEAAFQTLGQLAMKELMSDPEVNQRMAGFQQYIDQARLNQALSGSKP